MKTISSLAQIRNIGGKVYVRWSKSIALDNKRGYSLRGGTTPEAGISCCVVKQDWEDYRILRQLNEYCFCGNNCWLVTGDEVGRGGDGEELLINVECIGRVSDTLLGSGWERMKLEKEIADNSARLSKVTDAFARTIIENTIAAAERKLSDMRDGK